MPFIYGISIAGDVGAEKPPPVLPPRNQGKCLSLFFLVLYYLHLDACTVLASIFVFVHTLCQQKFISSQEISVTVIQEGTRHRGHQPLSLTRIMWLTQQILSLLLLTIPKCILPQGYKQYPHPTKILLLDQHPNLPQRLMVDMGFRLARVYL